MQIMMATLTGSFENLIELINDGANVNFTDNKGKTALIKASQHGINKIVVDLINRGANVNIKDNKGETALMKASSHGNVETVQSLITAGADVNKTDRKGFTALMKAVYRGNNEIALALITAGADLNTADEKNQTALMKALITERADVNLADSKGFTALMKAVSQENHEPLITGGADVNKADRNGLTALMKATYCEKTEIAETLINGGADVNLADRKGSTALMDAIHCENKETAKKLITERANINLADQKGLTALMKAINRGNNEIALALITAGADLNIADEKNQTALMKAIYHNNATVALELISKGSDVNITDYKGFTALMKAAEIENNEIALALIKNGADLNVTDSEGETSLMKAINRGNYEIAVAMINGGADMNIADNEGFTALVLAAYRGNNDITQALIEGGADVNLVDKINVSALMISTYSGNNEISQALIKHGADVNAADDTGVTALMYAAERGNFEIAQSLILREVKVNISDKEGETALMKASYHGNENIALALIDDDASVNAVDNKGNTALMKAASCGNREIVSALIKKGARVDIADNDGQPALVTAVRHKDVVATLIVEGNAEVNKPDSKGRTPLFYAILEGSDAAGYLLEKGANLHQTDSLNLDTVSFVINYLISNNLNRANIKDVYKTLIKIGIKEQAIIAATVNALFCKLPLCYANENVLVILQLAISKMRKKWPTRKRKYIISRFESIYHILARRNLTQNGKPKIYELRRLLLMLIDLGADPNTVDEVGNTACHYFAQLVLHFSHLPPTLNDIFRIVEAGSTKKNSNQETPLFLCLSSALIVVKEKGGISGIGNLLQICELFLEDRISANETSKSGKTVFHLIIQLVQEGLNLQDNGYQETFLLEILQLMKLFSTPKVAKDVTVNKVDDENNSPLHFWACLEFPSAQKYTSTDVKVNFENILHTIFTHLLQCGIHLNSRNQNEETPLHLCKTWSAVKFLVAEQAKTKEVDSANRSPLLVAAQNNLFMRIPDRFYPDVKDDSRKFWENVVSMGFDPLVRDKDGDTVMGNLLKGEAFALAKALVEVLCENDVFKHDEDLICVMDTICKDQSTRTVWKKILIQMILNSRTGPIDLSSSLRLCCMNILDDMSANTAQDHISEIHCENDVYSAEEENLTQKNVHWQNAKQLLLHGTSGQKCLDLADGCSELQHLLTTPCINEVSKVIPWTSHSKAFEKRLAEVARQRNCTAVEGTTYWTYDDDIARGAFGHVFAGINEKDGMEVAIKRIESLNMKRRQDKREIRTFTALTGCKQIVQYLGYFESKEFSYIVLELMEGTLDDYFLSTVYDTANTNVLSKDVAIGLNHLHDQNIIHRDLKPSNILYKTHPNLCLKIADFGLSRPMDLDFSESVMSKSVGTVGWIAPEVANGDSDHSKSSDIFCCGLVFHYFFSSQQHPFNPADCTGKNEIQLQAIRNSNLYVDKKMEGWNTSLSAEVSDLLKKMLEFDENQRPSALDMMEHPMFWSEKKKMDFLSAVGNQPEIEYPATSSSVSPVNADLEAKFSTIIKHPKWDDSGYKHMPTIFAEMTRPIVKTFKKGKTRTVAARKYDTTSVIQLIRFIRNTISHVSQAGLPSQIRSLILIKCVFQKEFPRLVMELYNAVVKHGWNTREEIKHAINN